MIQKSMGDQLSCHRDDIITLAVSKDRKKVVTGQIGKYPSVHVWDAQTSEQIHSIKMGVVSGDSRGVLAVGFSSCQRYISIVEDNDSHRVTIYNLERKCVVLEMESSKSEVSGLAWSKRSDDLRFAVVGPKEI